jgi:hypothetical protein
MHMYLSRSIIRTEIYYLKVDSLKEKIAGNQIELLA